MPGQSFIIYDGECIFCQNYVRFVRLRSTIGKVELIDARSDDPRVVQHWNEGFDLDEGMIFVHRDQVFYGADAINVLASFSSANGLFNRLNAAMFRSPVSARLLYPALKLGRRLTLKLRGIQPLAAERLDR